MVLRKEVYLGSVAAIARLQYYIAVLGNIDLPESEIMRGYNDDLASIGKIQVVGSMETVRSLSAFIGEFRR
jgi:hypothetical protein